MHQYETDLMAKRSVFLFALTIVMSLLAMSCRGQGDASETFSTVGMPHASDFSIQMLNNKGFKVGYASRWRSAVWVVYRARKVPWRGDFDRPKYHADSRVSNPVPWYAYSDTGYNRGHLAPNYIISRLYGRKAQKQTFLMTNITPQKPRFNQLLWQRLEEIESNYMAPAHTALRVTTGPIFGADSEWIENGPAIPVAFYRLWLDRLPDGRYRAMAFVVPQSVRGDERLDQFIVSVDRVEARTGLDFYPGLPDSRERNIETKTVDPKAWGFAQHACMPARYAEDWRGRGDIELNFERCTD